MCELLPAQGRLHPEWDTKHPSSTATLSAGSSLSQGAGARRGSFPSADTTTLEPWLCSSLARQCQWFLATRSRFVAERALLPLADLLT